MLSKSREQSVMTDSVVIIMANEKKEETSYFQGNRTAYCCISCRNLTKIIIHLILPLTLGIFTVVITLYQQEMATKQRLEDRDQARIQRDQDLNISGMQRERDQFIAREQREQDELRRLQDLNISTAQRDLDLYIAESKQAADDLNAEKQRNMSQEQRQHELKIEQQRYDKQMAIENERYEQERAKYQAQLSLSYMNEIGDLLGKHNGRLNSDSTSAALARAKTLNVIGQLGSNRSRNLIEFLYDAKQLTTNDNPLDLSGAQLNGLDFSGPSGLQTRQKLSLVGIYLNKAIFEGLEIVDWDFTSASLNGAVFRNCNISNTSFARASLIGADFSFSYLDLNIFSRADLSMSNFHAVVARSSSFEDAILIRANFSNVKFHAMGSDRHLRFSYSNLVSATFRDAFLIKIHFRLCNMTNVDLNRATIVDTSFFGSVLAFASIADNKYPLKFSSFQYANLSHVNFSGSICADYKCDINTILSFHNAYLPDGRLGLGRAKIIKNGDASLCEFYNKASEVEVLFEAWDRQPLSGFTVRREASIQNQCVYAMTKNVPGKLTQTVLLNGPYKPSFNELIIGGLAVAIFRASLSEGVEIFIEKKSTGQLVLRNHSLSRSGFENNSSFITSNPIILHSDAKQLRFTINFNNPASIRWLQLIDIEINPKFWH